MATEFSILHAGSFQINGPFTQFVDGVGRILQSFNAKVLGSNRIANDSLAGYCVYVGNDAPVNLAAGPTAFNASLPINVTVTPPISGTATINVLVRKRNKYGLESLNQKTTSFQINSSGAFVQFPLDPPSAMQGFIVGPGKIRVLISYPGYGIDLYPATGFKIWIGTSPPDVELDGFEYEGLITSNAFGVDLPETYIPDDYHLAVCLTRDGDDMKSSPITNTVTVPDSPSTPTLL